MSFEPINPERLGTPRGWTNGMLAPGRGRVLFIAGQTAAHPEGGSLPSGFAAQFEEALGKVVLVLESAGGEPRDIGRMTIYVTDMERYRKNRGNLREPYRRMMGNHYPAMALVEVSGLVDEGALVEIEATAVLASGGGG